MVYIPYLTKTLNKTQEKSESIILKTYAIYNMLVLMIFVKFIYVY